MEGGGWSFRQVGHFDGIRGRQGKWAARVLNYSRVSQHAGNSPPPLFVSLIGEYLASEIYPNHHLEFRPPRSTNRSSNRFVKSIFLGDECPVTSIPSLGHNEALFSPARNVLPRSMQRFFFKSAAYNNISSL